MNDNTSTVPLICVTDDIREIRDGLVVREQPLTLLVNGQEFLTTLCSPIDMNYLAAGILESEGIIHEWNDITELEIDSQRGIANIKTIHPVNIDKNGLKPLVASGGCKGNISIQNNFGDQIGSTFTMSADDIRSLMPIFLKSSQTYYQTRGMHSAALCRDGKIVHFNEDIGRHNALDKVAGWLMAEQLDAAELAVITSGRISSEILLKVARRGFPMIISKAPPTDLGVKLAVEWGVTMVRYDDGSLCIYSHDWRVL